MTKNNTPPVKHYKIAMVAACPFPCERGTPVRIHRMAEALLAQGHEVHIVTYHLSEPVTVHPDLHIHRIRPVQTYRKMSPGPSLQKLIIPDPLLAQLLYSLLRSQSFDIIHAHHIEGLLVAMAGRLGLSIPLVYDIHTLLHSELPYYLPPWLQKPASAVGRVLDYLLPKWADYLIPVTDTIRDELLAKGAASPDRCTTISNGVELELFQTNERNKRRTTECIITFTGNLASYQGIGYLLKAFAILHGKRPNTRLRIVSQESITAHESLTRQLGIDRAIELIQADFDAVPAALATSNIAVNPRVKAPGIPMKLVNYMAAGMPIVSFRGSSKYLVDEVSALLVPDGDVVALASALLRLVDEPALAERLGRRARTVVEEKLSWERTATEVTNVYAAIVRP